MTQTEGSFALFIGYQRSGHSIVGALLDAHPDVVISHELHALKRLQEGADRRTLFMAITALAFRQATEGRREGRYSYAVPGQWQGRIRHPRVIGDKKGNGTTKLLRECPDLLDRLAATVRRPLRIIHVIRNPFDNISSILRYQGLPPGEKALREAIDSYFLLAETNNRVREQYGGMLFDLKHEDFVEDPEAHLAALCRFLEVEADTDYLKACASLVKNKVNKSRFEFVWPPEFRDLVREKMASFDFLQGYAFED